jgi:hypothetical protein
MHSFSLPTKIIGNLDPFLSCIRKNQRNGKGFFDNREEKITEKP